MRVTLQQPGGQPAASKPSQQTARGCTATLHLHPKLSKLCRHPVPNCRVGCVEGELAQLKEQVRDRAVSLAETLKQPSVDKLEQLQLQGTAPKKVGCCCGDQEGGEIAAGDGKSNGEPLALGPGLMRCLWCRARQVAQG